VPSIQWPVARFMPTLQRIFGEARESMDPWEGGQAGAPLDKSGMRLAPDLSFAPWFSHACFALSAWASRFSIAGAFPSFSIFTRAMR
jgi:hypothetical protein